MLLYFYIFNIITTPLASAQVYQIKDKTKYYVASDNFWSLPNTT